MPQIAALVTHSPSQDNVTKAAVNLRRQWVIVFTIGVEGASDTQLEKIASHPAEQYVSQLRSFSDLAAHNQTFLKKLRNQITHTVSVISERTETLKAGKACCREQDQSHPFAFFLVLQAFCLPKGLVGVMQGERVEFLVS